MGKLRVILNIAAAVHNAAEHEVEIEITYSVQRGCTATQTQPGEADSVSISAIAVVDGDKRPDADWLIGLLEDDEDIQAECLADWHDDQAAAEEYRADAIREEQMLRQWEGR